MYSEESTDIDRELGGSNLLQVVVTGDRGWLYVNGRFQGGMDLSADNGGDGIKLFTDDEHPGETSYKDFAVWKWSPVVAEAFAEVDPPSDANTCSHAEPQGPRLWPGERFDPARSRGWIPGGVSRSGNPG